ncbi:MAG: diguanylate cyclase [Gammaproteobacteria bacterium]|nr:diguanylate cyclase [Gammaproteobacteria bacterium]
MTTNASILPEKPASISFATPIAILLVLLALLTGGFLQIAVNGQDRIAREASETIAEAAFNAEKKALAGLVRDYSWWNAAVENLIFELNTAWVNDNLGWLPENFGVSRVFVFGPGNVPVYASLDAEPVEPGNDSWRTARLLELVEIARSKPDEPGQFASAYVDFADGIHQVAASKLLQEERATGHPHYPDKGVLVVTRRIDEALLDRIEASFQLPGLDLQRGQSVAGGLAAFPLEGANGDTVAQVAWRPPQPGTRLLEGLILPLVLVFTLVGGVIALIMVRTRRAGKALQQAFEARVAAQKALEYSARHDPLTDLPNRALFLEHLTSAMAHAERYGSGFTLHYLDLDGFKEVNDTFGHPAGDDLLRELAARLRYVVRAADTVARFGGDEFAVLQRGTGDHDHASLLACRMIRAVEQPFEIDDHSVHVALSVGIAFDTGDDDPEEIIRKADRALYRAKRHGGNRYEHYDPVLDSGGIQLESSAARRPSLVKSSA